MENFEFVKPAPPVTHEMGEPVVWADLPGFSYVLDLRGHPDNAADAPSKPVICSPLDLLEGVRLFSDDEQHPAMIGWESDSSGLRCAILLPEDGDADLFVFFGDDVMEAMDLFEVLLPAVLTGRSSEFLAVRGLAAVERLLAEMYAAPGPCHPAEMVVRVNLTSVLVDPDRVPMDLLDRYDFWHLADGCMWWTGHGFTVEEINRYVRWLTFRQEQGLLTRDDPTRSSRVPEEEEDDEDPDVPFLRPAFKRLGMRDLVMWLDGCEPEVVGMPEQTAAEFFASLVSTGHDVDPPWSASEVRYWYERGFRRASWVRIFMEAHESYAEVLYVETAEIEELYEMVAIEEAPDGSPSLADLRTRYGWLQERLGESWVEFVALWESAMPLSTAVWYIADGQSFADAFQNLWECGFDRTTFETLWSLGAGEPSSTWMQQAVLESASEDLSQPIVAANESVRAGHRARGWAV